MFRTGKKGVGILNLYLLHGGKIMGRNVRNTVTTILVILGLLAFCGGSANADISISISPQCGEVGDTITITADSTSGGQYYRFFVNTLSHCDTTDRNWVIVKDWSTDKTATYILRTAGIKTFVVQVTNDTSQTCILEQMGATYDVGGVDCFHPTQVMLTPGSGAEVTIAAVTDGTNLQYRFYVREGDFCDSTQNLTFTLQEDWTNSNSFTFTPTTPGVYTLIIWSTSDITDSCVGQGGLVYVVTEQNFISLHDSSSPQYDSDCVSCHADILTRQSQDPSISDAHVAMLPWTSGATNNDKCVFCHESVDVLQKSSATVRRSVDVELCIECHGPGGIGGEYYK
jgi:hypothetical protein